MEEENKDDPKSCHPENVQVLVWCAASVNLLPLVRQGFELGSLLLVTVPKHPLPGSGGTQFSFDTKYLLSTGLSGCGLTFLRFRKPH